MADINRLTLFGKLDRIAYDALNRAIDVAKLRGNPLVELQHWLTQILAAQDSDLHHVLRHFEIDLARVNADLTAATDRLARGSTADCDLSATIDDATERGWVYASLFFGESRVRTGHLLLGMLKTPNLRGRLALLSSHFKGLNDDELARRFAQITAKSPEQALASSLEPAVGGAGGDPDGANGLGGRKEALARFAVDLTERARKGELDPVTGRDEEIRQIVDILMRRRQNNPILTGEAGVGKTAVVEGFAARLAKGDVPPQLQGVSLLALDIGLLQAGASMKGEFEQRLRQVIDEVQSSEKPIILFIDEVHTLVGAGGAAGTGDAANLLKPALARGSLRTIGATTWAEYKKHIEKDPALTRRFQVVQILEPDEAKAVGMLRGVASVLEKHHRVQLLDEAIEAAVKLSHRYIPARQLPDKAVSLLDTSCARVAISQHATPAELEDSQRRIEALQTELEIIGREESIGIDVGSRAVEARDKLVDEQQRRTELETRWKEEKTQVDRILELRAALRKESGPEDPQVQGEDLLSELRSLQIRLAEQQGERPLILPSVDAHAVSSVVADWTGIPVGRMVKNEIEAVLQLADTLGQRIIGQRHALDMIARRIQTSRAQLDNPSKPIGVFLLAGTSGVGKTETALALAESLYGGEQNLITLNMSEYQVAHTVSTLKGAPPGYIGYGEGGVLTEAVRRRPYSVVLLDEVEKAHPDVHELFFQVFDKGWMEDGEGRVIDFKNTLILLTTNVGTELIAGMCKDQESIPDPEALAKALRSPLLRVFPPALLGRLVAIPYYPLSDQMLSAIVRLQLGRIQRRIQDNHKLPFDYDDEVVSLVVSRCTEGESGGRMIDAILTNTVLPRISEELLRRRLRSEPVSRVAVAVTDKEFDYRFD